MDAYIAELVRRTQTGSVCVSATLSYRPLSSNCALNASSRSCVIPLILCTSANSPASVTLTAIWPPSCGMTSITMPDAT